MKFDWSKGHVLTWFRTNCNDNVKRFFYSTATIPRDFDLYNLCTNLDQLGIHDKTYMGSLVEQYKRHYGGFSLRNHLAHCLFDPVVLLNKGQGYCLRTGNTIHRLEKEPYPGCVDISKRQVKVYDYRVQFIRKKSGNYLEITLAHDAIDRFKWAVTVVINSNAPIRHKLYTINERMNDFLAGAKWARSAWPQIKDLQNWLVSNLRPLYGGLKDARRKERDFRYSYTSNREDGLYLTIPNFFWDPRHIDMQRYLKFMSPYREI